MSRGPGKWQQLILLALTKIEYLPLLLIWSTDPNRRRSTYVALLRAASRLEALGQVKTWDYTERIPTRSKHGRKYTRPYTWRMVGRTDARQHRGQLIRKTIGQISIALDMEAAGRTMKALKASSAGKNVRAPRNDDR